MSYPASGMGMMLLRLPVHCRDWRAGVGSSPEGMVPRQLGTLALTRRDAGISRGPYWRGGKLARLVAALDSGISTRAAARETGYSKTTARKIYLMMLRELNERDVLCGEVGCVLRERPEFTMGVDRNTGDLLCYLASAAGLPRYWAGRMTGRIEAAVSDLNLRATT